MLHGSGHATTGAAAPAGAAAGAAGALARWRRHPLLVRLARYTAGSVLATVCSEAAFVVAYGPAGAGPRVAGVVGFVAGAIPNYGLNRRWAWQRRGRAPLAREVLPYVAVVLATAALATAAGSLADGHLRGLALPRALQVALVGLAYLLPYGSVFLLKFLLLEWLVFSGPAAGPPRRRRRAGRA
jgi:putative flippase GtrA